MFRTLARRLYRDRRRYMIVAILLFATGFITFYGVRSGEFGGLMPVIGGLGFMFGIGVFAPILSVLVPPLRSSCEVVAFTLFGQSILGRIVPDWSVLDHDNTQTIWMIIAASAIGHLYGSQTLDKLFRLDRVTQRTTARTRLDARTLFDGVIGTPGRIDAMTDPEDILSFERLPDDPATLRMVQKIHPFGTLEEHHRINAEDAPYMRDFDWNVVEASTDAPFTSGHVRFEIEDRGRYRHLTRVGTVNGFPSRAALFGWIDDFHGRHLDGEIAKLEKRGKDRPAMAEPIPA